VFNKREKRKKKVDRGESLKGKSLRERGVRCCNDGEKLGGGKNGEENGSFKVSKNIGGLGDKKAGGTREREIGHREGETTGKTTGTMTNCHLSRVLVGFFQKRGGRKTSGSGRDLSRRTQSLQGFVPSSGGARG